MRLQDLRIFLHVAREGNQYRAAEVLGLSQSSMSKALARIEHKIGMQIFERTARGVSLTDVGNTLVHHAEKVLLAVGDMENELGDQRIARSGTVRIGCLPSLLSALLWPVLSDFFINRPLATFSIEMHLSAQLISLLQNGRVDIALAASPDNLPADLEYQPLGSLTMLIVTRKGHPRRAQMTSMAALTQERWALPAESLFLRKWLEERFTSLDLPPPRVAVESTGTPIAFTKLLRNSDLLGLVPQSLIGRPETHGLLPLDGLHGSSHEVAIFWRKDGYLSPICRDFRNAIQTYSAATQL